MTLVEMIVVLAILSITAAVVGLSLNISVPSAADDMSSLLSSARQSALAEGRPVRGQLIKDGRLIRIMAMPDGSVVADSVFGVERWTGMRDASK